eukprot:TRINITY_DN273_c5_g1_i1.p1 TRINITY_DN273_c5_g1~~TRINITY_DN273_c5_g1_i1.p1  ORF type:complete len:490 (+),score=164.20 TRINITY_DN273_c5_g1_i1:41-1471(+)
MALTESEEYERNKRIVTQLAKLPENNRCADCGSKSLGWASATLGIFICIRCSGIHRSMGVGISFVRSVNLDQWETKHVRNMQHWGNRRAKQYYEANVPPGRQVPDERCSIRVLENWIRDKYDRRLFKAATLPPPNPSRHRRKSRTRRRSQPKNMMAAAMNQAVNIATKTAPPPSDEEDFFAVASKPVAAAASSPATPAVQSLSEEFDAFNFFDKDEVDTPVSNKTPAANTPIAISPASSTQSPAAGNNFDVFNDVFSTQNTPNTATTTTPPSTNATPSSVSDDFWSSAGTVTPSKAPVQPQAPKMSTEDLKASICAMYDAPQSMVKGSGFSSAAASPSLPPPQNVQMPAPSALRMGMRPMQQQQQQQQHMRVGMSGMNIGGMQMNMPMNMGMSGGMPAPQSLGMMGRPTMQPSYVMPQKKQQPVASSSSSSWMTMATPPMNRTSTTSVFPSPGTAQSQYSASAASNSAMPDFLAGM